MMKTTQYLVLMTCTMDDFPLYLTDDECKAFAYARNRVSPGEKIQKMFGIDATEPVCVKVVTFEHGKPTLVETVRDF